MNYKSAQEKYESIRNKALNKYKEIKSQNRQYEAYRFIEPWLESGIEGEKVIEICMETLNWVDNNFEELSKAPIRKDINNLCRNLLDTISRIEMRQLK